jgi:hypothetical protein
MLAALVVVLRSLALICCGYRAVALENLALRQQLAVFRRTNRRPPLRHRDRMFWVREPYACCEISWGGRDVRTRRRLREHPAARRRQLKSCGDSAAC